MEKKHRELDTTMLIIMHSPTIFLLYGGFAPEYLIGFSLISALTICHKTTTILSNFVILMISFLTHAVPIIFIILEAISMLQSASTLKFYNPQLHSRTAKQLAAVFLFNSILYLYIAIVLLYSAGYLHEGNPYYPTGYMRVAFTVYAVIKFGTIITAFLKQPIYELLPLGTVASVSALTLSLVPIVVSIAMSAQIASAGAAVFIILTNFMSF